MIIVTIGSEELEFDNFKDAWDTAFSHVIKGVHDPIIINDNGRILEIINER